MRTGTIPILAIISWALPFVCPGQSPPSGRVDPGLAFQEIDTLARDNPGGLPGLLRSKLSATTSVAKAGALVGRSFRDVGEKMTVPLARSIDFESDYADQEAVLEIERDALLNSPSRLHPQIVAATIESVIDPEQPVIIETAGVVPSPEKGERVDEEATGQTGEKFRVNLEASDPGANLPAQEGPLTYRLAAPGEPGALALGDAILAVATTVDPKLDRAEFPTALNGHFLPGFNPPGLAASGPYNLRDPVDPNILDPLSEILDDPDLLLVKPLPSPTPVSP